jgi:2-polyprenyl-3-methyl-5-hydroxy-6-metoxy-1,4-benzoquinol methylase
VFEAALADRYEAEHGGLHYWPGHRQWWLEDMGVRHEERLMRFYERFDPLIRWSGKRCLDMGCGTGAALIALGALGADVVGIDTELVGEDLAFAHVRAAVYGMEVGLRHGDGTALDFPDASFDVIASNSVAEHVPDVEAYFREAFRVLKPGGWFVFATDNRAWIREGHTGVRFAHWLPYATFKRLGNRAMGKPEDTPLDVYPRTWAYYRRLGKRTGFVRVAGRFDSVALDERASAGKRRLARFLVATRVPFEAVLEGTLIVFRKPEPR